MRRLRDRGVAIVFISHRLEEVEAIADVVTILRDGAHIATGPGAELPRAEMIRLMVGRSLDQLFPKEEAEIGDVVLRADGLGRRGVFGGVTFELRRGEIVGLAGFVGSGRTEVARSIFGIDRLDAGRLWIDGRPFRPRSPRAALRRGLAYLPEDRLSQGLVQSMSIAANASLAVLPQLTPAGILRPRSERVSDRIQALIVSPVRASQVLVASEEGPQTLRQARRLCALHVGRAPVHAPDADRADLKCRRSSSWRARDWRLRQCWRRASTPLTCRRPSCRPTAASS